ncbi:lipocalin/fatty-acid binding family protein [Streptomyces sp. NPDC058401]|uniref:lipocalin/fatty-acid binding family protein n=1 Tax=Streptomyces sp. NPDC058401 TaxID=3346480 RepID=UPI0036460951
MQLRPPLRAQLVGPPRSLHARYWEGVGAGPSRSCFRYCGVGPVGWLSAIVGKYELLSDPKDKAYDAFLEAAGVSDAHREAFSMVSPSAEISSAGGQWSVRTLSELVNEEALFTSGAETTTRFFGTDAVSVFTVEGSNKLVHDFTAAGKASRTVSEFAADGMTVTLSSQGKTAVRKYKRVA